MSCLPTLSGVLPAANGRWMRWMWHEECWECLKAPGFLGVFWGTLLGKRWLLMSDHPSCGWGSSLWSEPSSGKCPGIVFEQCLQSQLSVEWCGRGRCASPSLIQQYCNTLLTDSAQPQAVCFTTALSKSCSPAELTVVSPFWSTGAVGKQIPHPLMCWFGSQSSSLCANRSLRGRNPSGSSALHLMAWISSASEIQAFESNLC